MDRRRFFLRAGALGAAALIAKPVRAQDPDADRLRMPGAVQRRTTVTEAQNDETVKAIERRMKCTCGCNLDIFTCRTTDFACATSPELHREVVALLEAGNTPDEVVAEFVARHGEEILMAPIPEGFNLTGYFLPGAALLVAGSILTTVLMRRHRVARLDEPAGVTVPGAAAPLAGVSADELARLEAALEEVER